MKKLYIVMTIAAGLMFAGITAAGAATYTVDPAHTSVGFAIQHMMLSKVNGTFSDVSGTVNFDPAALESSMVHVMVKVASIDTRNAQRDTHLRSADFFDADKFPEMMFVSQKIVKDGDGYLVTGEMTIKGVTQKITVPVTVLGPVKNPMSGALTLGMEAHFKINRQDYGIVWNKVLDNGGVMIANDVDVSVSLEATEAQGK